MYNLPNLLTLLRVILIPIFVGLFYYPTDRSNMFAAIVFVVAALTDLLDGYLARKLKQTTKFGAFLDPVADKIIVCTALVLIVDMVIIAREIVVSALREWMAEIGQRAQVAVNWVGKWKTTIQMTAIALLVWRYNEPMIYAAVGLLGLATILTIWSMVMYLKVGLSHMSEDPKAEVIAGSAPNSSSSAISAASTANQEEAQSVTTADTTATSNTTEDSASTESKPVEKI